MSCGALCYSWGDSFKNYALLNRREQIDVSTQEVKPKRQHSTSTNSRNKELIRLMGKMPQRCPATFIAPPDLPLACPMAKMCITVILSVFGFLCNLNSGLITLNPGVHNLWL